MSKSLDSLKTLYPEITQKILDNKPTEGMRFFQSSGMENFSVSSKGVEYPAYDPDNPRRGVRGVFKSLKLESDHSTIIVGIGCGHLLKEALIKKDKQHNIVVIEPVKELLEKALDLYDFSKWIENGTLIICSEEKQLAEFVGTLEGMFVIQDWNVLIERYATILPVYYKLIEFVGQLLNSIRCNTGTVMGAGAIIARNDIENLPYIIRHRGVNELKDLFKGKPAILVCTGPSLKKNVHLLRSKQREGAVIIAVAQAARILLAYEVRPDFICTVDYGKTNYEHFHGLMDCDIPLVMLNRTYADIIREYTGPKFIVSNNDNTPGSFTEIIYKKGGLEQGGSVAHMAVGLGIHLGCEPIGIIGQDLALTDNRSHIETVDAGGRVEVVEGEIQWIVEDPTSHLKEVRHSMGPAVYVPGYFGGNVLTNVGLSSFLHSYDAILRDKTVKVIDCTEGGAELPRMGKMSLQKFLDSYCNNAIDRNIEYLCTLADNYESDLDAAIGYVESDIKNMKDMVDEAKKALDTTEKLLAENDKTKIKGLLAENEKHSKAAENLARLNSLVGISIYAESRRIQAKELRVKASVRHLLNDQDDLKIRIERNQIILKSAIKAGDDLLPLYEKTLGILKGYKETHDESLLINAKEHVFDFSACDSYFKNGNWARPLLESKKELPRRQDIYDHAIGMRSLEISKAVKAYDPEKTDKLLEYNALIKKAQDAGRLKDFRAALDNLEAAHKLMPEDEIALWGLATTKHFLKDVDGSIDAFKKLHELKPDNPRYAFEYGNVLLMKDVDAGLAIISKAMEKTHDYDSFFMHMGDLLMSMHRVQDAERAYRIYEEKFPFDPRIAEKLVNVYSELGNKKMKNKYLKKVRNG